jgi:pseudaminic acid cytidylyltransferase
VRCCRFICSRTQGKLRRLAIIPARGGSKRLPRKNILPILGKPMVAWSIEAAVQSELFERVVVSSDFDEILEISEKYGAEARRRAPGLSQDSSSVNEVVESILTEELELGRSYDELFLLYATAPLRTSDDLIAMAQILENEVTAKAVIATTKFIHYPHQALTVTSGNQLKPMWPELIRKKATSLPSFVVGNASTYAIKVAEFQAYLDFFVPSGMHGYYMPFWRSVDIDTQEDYDLVCSLVAGGIERS